MNLISRRRIAGARLVPVIGVILLAACTPEVIDAPLNVPPTGRRLSVGESTVCALDAMGTVYCWGTNSNRWEYGASVAQIPTSSSPVAVPIPPLAVINGGNGQHMCGILQTRQAICWGRGQSGQLGGGALGALGNPAIVVQPPGAAWTDISVSRLTACALSLAGDGFCWGANQRGEIGNPDIALGGATGTPSQVIHEGVVFRSIVPGWLHTCGIATSGAAYCWGDNSSGQLGIGFADGDLHLEPLLVSFIDQYEQISLGSRSTCGITVDHRTLCWGFNANGQLGDGTTNLRTFPTPVATGGVKFRAIALGSGFGGGTNATLPNTGQASWGHTCAISEGGAPYCWGWNGAGQVGDGTTTTRLTPVPVLGGLTLTSIALGGSSSCGMSGDAIWCWGSNLAGQLGNGTNVNSPIPVAVTGPFAKP